MLVLHWGLKSDRFDTRTVMGGKDSIFMIWFYLTHHPATDGTRPDPATIKVFDLAGNEQDISHWPSVTPTRMD